MRRTLALLVGLGLCWAGGASAEPPPLTAEQILARHVEARGGLERLHALKSLRRTGHAVFPGVKVEMAVIELRARPARLRVENVLHGLVTIDAFDGQGAWKVRPFYGRKDPERTSADEAKALRLSADIEGPLVEPRAKGHTVSLLGVEELDGTPCYKLRVDLKWGDQLISHVDPETFMVLRELQRTVIRGAEQFTEVDYGDYEKVAGVYVPMLEESGPRASPSSEKSKVVYDRAEANVPVDDALFAFPGPAPRASR
ncbi:MAG TPA: hypothetical protein VLT82_11585 [Myxococcaceae bacterium]|nr:hypothetical protein [Myxococcaceae bacterium]